MKTLVNIALDDPKAERVRRADAAAIVELQGDVFAGAKLFPGVVLPDGTAVNILHGLGRAPRLVGVSVVRADVPSSLTAGVIQELPGTDRTKLISLYAHLFSTTVTVDVVVA